MLGTVIVLHLPLGVQVPGDGDADDEPQPYESVQALDTMRLGKFLAGAVTVVESILSENVGELMLNRFSFGSDSEWSSSCIISSAFPYPLTKLKISNFITRFWKIEKPCK